MSRDRVRLLHVASLRLDDLPPVATVLPAAAREIVARAPFRALENAVAAAIDQNVDAVILAGETFDEAARSLAGRVALRDAFRQLEPRGIPVVVAPGRRDPLSAWSTFPGLPENVSVLEPDESVVVDRDGVPVVAIEGITPRTAVGRRESDEDAAPFRVAVMLLDDPSQEKGRGRERKRSTAKSEAVAGLFEAVYALDAARSGLSLAAPEEDAIPRELLGGLPWVYIAPAALDRRVESAADQTVLHSPGSVQAVRGGALVTLRAERRAECEFVALSPVAIESMTVRVHPRDAEEDLVARMREMIRRHSRTAGEECLLVRWTLRGSGPLLLALADHEYQQLLADAVDEEASRKSLHLAHSFRLQSTRFDLGDDHGIRSVTWPAARPAVWTGEANDERPSLIDQAIEAFRSVTGAEAATTETIPADAAWDSAEPFDARLKPVLERLDPASVAGLAARLVESWFEGSDAARRNP